MSVGCSPKPDWLLPKQRSWGEIRSPDNPGRREDISAGPALRRRLGGPMVRNSPLEGTGFDLQSPPVGYYTLQEGGDVDQVCREDRPQRESRFLCAAAAARWASLFLSSSAAAALILFRSSRAFGRYLILGRSNREIGRSLLRYFFLPLHRADGVVGLGGSGFPVPSFFVPARPSNG